LTILAIIPKGNRSCSKGTVGRHNGEGKRGQRVREEEEDIGSRSAFSFQCTKRSFLGPTVGTSPVLSLPRLFLFLSLSLSLFSQEETVHREALFHPIQPLCLHRAEVDGPLTQFFKWIADAARVPRVFSSSPHSPPSLSLSLSHPFSS